MDDKLEELDLEKHVVAIHKLSPEGYTHPRTHIGDGEIAGTPFTLYCSVTGNLEVQFDDDADNGRFLLVAKHFIQAAYTAYCHTVGKEKLGE